ncbi:hypothetical protein HDU67_005135, partial [Dinochytrium kinnereticum]
MKPPNANNKRALPVVQAATAQATKEQSAKAAEPASLRPKPPTRAQLRRGLPKWAKRVVLASDSESASDAERPAPSPISVKLNGRLSFDDGGKLHLSTAAPGGNEATTMKKKKWNDTRNARAAVDGQDSGSKSTIENKSETTSVKDHSPKKPIVVKPVARKPVIKKGAISMDPVGIRWSSDEDDKCDSQPKKRTPEPIVRKFIVGLNHKDDFWQQAVPAVKKQSTMAIQVEPLVQNDEEDWNVVPRRRRARAIDGSGTVTNNCYTIKNRYELKTTALMAQDSD